jgi:hypothetical protein
MKVCFYILPCLGTLLEGLLVWRLSKRRLASHYPYLAAFVVCSLSREFALFPVSLYRPHQFAEVYWRAETISLFFRFFVIWEFFRGAFPRDSILHDVAWKSLMTVEVVVLPFILLLTWQQASASQHYYPPLSPIFEQYLSLAQAFLLLVPAGIAWYYGAPLGRNMRGLVLGFGIYLPVCSINFGTLQVFRAFFPYGRFLAPTAYVGMIAVWLWAFWEYESPLKVSSVGCADNDYRRAGLAQPLDSQRGKFHQQRSSI